MIQSRKNLNSCTSRAEKSKLVRILEIRILTTQHSILIYSRQGGCERTHNNIKSIVKFDVREVRKNSKKLYVLTNFVIYQILLMMHFAKQNSSGSTTRSVFLIFPIVLPKNPWD